jgi:hypothetical protein
MVGSYVCRTNSLYRTSSPIFISISVLQMHSFTFQIPHGFEECS